VEKVSHDYMLAAVEDLAAALDAVQRAWIGDPAESVNAADVDTLRRVEVLATDVETLLVRAALLAQDVEERTTSAA
jgi:hypothetical protein